MKNIKNIIFDLGGVLLDIDFEKTSVAFKQLGVDNFDSFYSQHAANDLFEKLETGKISEQEFYSAIRNFGFPSILDEQIQAAWNALLLQFRIESILFLDPLKEHYNIFLLSNTNAIHQKAFEKSFSIETGKSSLNDCFIKAYYSHIIEMRKPYPATYEYVLQDGKMKASETLFIDDSYVNIDGAKQAGLKTHLLLSTERIENLGLGI